MGMSLNSGGHITHGLKISMSGKWFNAIGYDVDKKSDPSYLRTKLKNQLIVILQT